jgi:hypothetical protein
MRLILSQFLRTLRERDEFDRLLPDLLVAMGYVPLAKPQTGVRQFGIDLAAVGKSPSDGLEEMLLFVIKRGDIGRRDWDNGDPTSVRPSINEALDFYLTKLVAPEHASLRKTIVLATTGDIKQDIDSVWTAFKEVNAARSNFDFWGGDRVADLIERHMLDEHLFAADDRSDLRRALALAGDGEYDFRDLNRLLLRQLGLKADGSLADSPVDARALRKTVRRMHLASQICAHWAQSEGDTRQALWVSERALLWTWHRIQLLNEDERAQFYPDIADLWQSYTRVAGNYFEVIQPHLHVRDGMAGYGSEGAEFAVVLFEHIGLLAAIGLACCMEAPQDRDAAEVIQSNVEAIADGLCALIENNPASASPRLDGHAIDVCLALFFLVNAGRTEQAKKWLAETAKRLDYCFKVKSKFPVSTDSLEDLVALEVSPGDDTLRTDLMRTSWCLATIAGWCVILGLDEHYSVLSRGASESYADVCAQLWHPTRDWTERWYFGGALNFGDAEAPYALPADLSEMRQRILDFVKRPEHEWVEGSPSRNAGLWAIDFIACRHLRLPVPASAWYRMMPSPQPAAEPTSHSPQSSP